MALEQLPRLTSQSSLVERVKYQLSSGVPYIIIYGPRESGRTVFTEQLISVIDDSAYHIAFIPCRNQTDLAKQKEALLSQLAPLASYSIDDHLVGILQRIDFGKQRVLIVIDDADEADPQFISDVTELYLTYARQGLFSVVMTSTPIWADSRLREFKNLDFIPQLMAIKSLSDPESLLLLSYYFKQLGCEAPSDQVLRSLPDYRESDGNPGSLKHLAENEAARMKPDIAPADAPASSDLHINISPEDAPVSDSHVKGTKCKLNGHYPIIIGAVSAAVLVALIALWVIHSNGTDASNRVSTDDVMTDLSKDNGNSGSEALQPELSKNRSDLSSVTNTAKQDNNEEDHVVAGLPEPVEEAPVVVGDNDSGDTANVHHEIVVTDSAVKAIENDNATTVNSENGKALNDNKALSEKPENSPIAKDEVKDVAAVKQDASVIKPEDKVVIKPEDKTVNKPVDTEDKSVQDIENKTVGKAAEKPVVTDVKNNQNAGSAVVENRKTEQSAATEATDNKKVQSAVEKTTEVKKQPVSLNAGINHNADTKISDLSSEHYTIQLGAGTQAGLKEIRNSVSGSSWVLYRPRDNQYILIYGDYSNAAAAAKAVSSLPASVRKNHPWAKKISVVKAETEASK